MHVGPQEGEDFEVVPGKDFTVARTANRDNTSDYYINNRKVPVKEVTTLLKGKGIDLDNNRFLILQGGSQAVTCSPASSTSKAAQQCCTGASTSMPPA